METLDALLGLMDAEITHRLRYLAGAVLAPALDVSPIDGVIVVAGRQALAVSVGIKPPGAAQ